MRAAKALEKLPCHRGSANPSHMSTAFGEGNVFCWGLTQVPFPEGFRLQWLMIDEPFCAGVGGLCSYNWDICVPNNWWFGSNYQRGASFIRIFCMTTRTRSVKVLGKAEEWGDNNEGKAGFVEWNFVSLQLRIPENLNDVLADPQVKCHSASLTFWISCHWYPL